MFRGIFGGGGGGFPGVLETPWVAAGTTIDHQE